MAGPLAGVVVLDLTQQLVGPGGTMLLGDMGADVIHVEPPPVDVPGQARDKAGRMRAGLNHLRSKRSISLDLGQEAAREIVYEIAKRADVCYQNYRPGVAEKLKVDYETIKPFNPSIVYLAVNAFGFSGPELHRVGFDIIAQAGGGSMAPSYRDPSLPAPLSAPLADVTGMCLGALAVVSALYHRKETGEGQQVKTSLLHGVVLQNILRLISIEDEDRGWREATLAGVREMAQDGAGANFAAMTEATATGIGGLPAAQRDAGALAGNVYYRTYRTADGFIAIGCLNLRQQERLNEALELGDPRFEDVDPASQEALERSAGMQEHAEQLFASKTTDHWIEFLDARTVACGRVLTVLEMFDHPHLLANEMVIEYDDPYVGPVKVLGYPIRFEQTPMKIQRPAPATGADTDEILTWLGHDAAAIGQLRERAIAF